MLLSFVVSLEIRLKNTLKGSIDILEILVLLKNYFWNITGENISQEIILKNKDEKINSFLREIVENEFMSRKHKKVCTILNYIKYFLISACTVIECISNLCIYFFACYSYWNYEFYNRIKNLCNDCGN